MKHTNSAFRRVLGNTPQIGILDVFVSAPDNDFQIKEIVTISGVSKTSVERLFPGIKQQGIVKPTRKIGNATLYKLNRDNKIAEALIVFNGVCCRDIKK